MNKYSKNAASLALFLFFVSLACAQESGNPYNPKDYRKKPVWIDMMNDPNANYYETIKAFREFWKGYRLPGEPEEMEDRDGFERAVGLEPEKPKKRESEAERRREKTRKMHKGGTDYAFEVKQFKGWLIDAQPWVQENGHILTLEERQQILDKQKQELKDAEKRH